MERPLVTDSREITDKETHITYTLKRSARARTLSITVYPGGSCVLTAPTFVSESVIVNYLFKHANWVLGAIKRLRHVSPLILPGSKTDLTRYRKEAYALAKERLNYFNTIYGFLFRNITIRNQKTRWGSCSMRGNLSFNYKIALLPLKLADYVIVHELCHVKHFNHSREFWAEVARVVPDYQELREQLKSGKFAVC